MRPLAIDAALTERWLEAFLRDELIERRRNRPKPCSGLSGGIDSAVVAYLCARALGPAKRVRDSHAVPHVERRIRCSTRSASSTRSGSTLETIEISAAVDGYLAVAGDPIRAAAAT